MDRFLLYIKVGSVDSNIIKLIIQIFSNERPNLITQLSLWEYFSSHCFELFDSIFKISLLTYMLGLGIAEWKKQKITELKSESDKAEALVRQYFNYLHFLVYDGYFGLKVML